MNSFVVDDMARIIPKTSRKAQRASEDAAGNSASVFVVKDFGLDRRWVLEAQALVEGLNAGQHQVKQAAKRPDIVSGCIIPLCGHELVPVIKMGNIAHSSRSLFALCRTFSGISAS